MKKKNLILTVVISLLFIFIIYQYYIYNILNDNIISLNEEINTQSVILNQKISNVEDDLKKNKQDLVILIQATQTENQQELQDLKQELESDIKEIKVESADFSAIVQDILESVVSVVTDKGQGSGVFLRTSGYIVTNEHVIRGMKSIGILTYDGEWHSVRLVGFDSDSDVALLQIEQQYPHLQTLDSDDIQVGEKVIALGNPSGLSFTVTEGIVSAVNRVVSSNNIGYIQTDVPISPGSSGGPIVNKEGKIIGITNFKISRTGFEGLGFAIPSNVVDDVVNQLID